MSDDLVRYVDTVFSDGFGEEGGGWLELTALGRKFIDEIKKQNSND